MAPVMLASRPALLTVGPYARVARWTSQDIHIPRKIEEGARDVYLLHFREISWELPCFTYTSTSWPEVSHMTAPKLQGRLRNVFISECYVLCQKVCGYGKMGEWLLEEKIEKACFVFLNSLKKYVQKIAMSRVSSLLYFLT